MAAYPGLSLIMVRSFIEHRAAEHATQRTAIVDAGLVLAATVPQQQLPLGAPPVSGGRLVSDPRALAATSATRCSKRNGRYYLPGYAAVAWRWLFRSREPVIHPYLRRSIERSIDGSTVGPAGPRQPA